ncbi:hypothetical protein [Streptomyces sp. SID8499]|uniref:hypothetical protein n=1 Tax=Streptomyces sp. SID8499 TaxID=2706106 RepID=UPI0013CAFEBC|nr:hypothetical protein [Streptomyces sp. SID8499]NED31139.1 hypothetical protein [Streptomyces sp. SID8499]
MKKTVFEYACGHAGTADLPSPTMGDEHDLKTAWLAEKLCPNCRRDAETRERLRAAGERVRAADAMRRAAIAEMGEALLYHRAVFAAAAPEVRASYRLQLAAAEELTGVSRRTLSDATRTRPTERSDAAVAAEHRDYGYAMHRGGEDLHRRYPHLAGLHNALMLLDEVQRKRWLAEHPEAASPPLSLDYSADQWALKNEYERQVNAIAEGRPI